MRTEHPDGIRMGHGQCRRAQALPQTLQEGHVRSGWKGHSVHWGLCRGGRRARRGAGMTDGCWAPDVGWSRSCVLGGDGPLPLAEPGHPRPPGGVRQ